jgi:hypothetical protein
MNKNKPICCWAKKLFGLIGLILNKNKNEKKPCYMGEMFIDMSPTMSFAMSPAMPHVPCHHTSGGILFNMLWRV